MSVVEPGEAGGAAASSLFERAKGLLFAPTPELQRAKAEQPTAQGLMVGYVLPLAAAMAIANLVGQTLFGFSAFGVSIQTGFGYTLLNSVIYLVLLVAMTWVMAQVIDGLAANFAAQKDPVRAMQTAAYAATGGLVYGLVGTVPWIGWALALFGVLVSVMLLHKGLGLLMGSPADKQIGYTATVILIMLVLWIIAGTVVGAITTPLRQAGLFAGGPTKVSTPWGKVETKTDGEDKVKVTIPGVGTIDTGDIANSIEVAGADGKPVTLIETDKLKALMPETLPGGFKRGSFESSSGSAMGFGAASVTATYTSGAKSIDLTLTDTGAAGALGAGLATAFGGSAETETEDGYTRARVVDGRMTVEEVSKSAGTASYTVFVGKRVAVMAQGTGVSADEVKRLIEAVGLERVEALAKAG
jgi:hypothetical protein